jgi:glutathione peroxidase
MPPGTQASIPASPGPGLTLHGSALYDFSFTRLDGGIQPLSAFAGQPLLIVNTASRCGFTPQYAGLQALHQRYAAQGLIIIGFPCNQFGAQEPGSASDIAQFCQRNYGVDFLMAAKVQVRGPRAHPLFDWLTRARPGLWGTRAIKWNFTKFLINRQGEAITRYAPLTPPARLEEGIGRVLFNG